MSKLAKIEHFFHIRWHYRDNITFELK